MTKKEMRKIIGENIRNLRMEYGLSRKSLAKLIGIPVNRLRRVEEGDPDAKLFDFHLRRLARVFDIPVDDIYEGISQ